jgi:hypothetical protein
LRELVVADGAVEIAGVQLLLLGAAVVGVGDGGLLRGRRMRLPLTLALSPHGGERG